VNETRVEEKSRPAPGVRVLLDQATIAARVREMGEELSRDYAGRRPLLIAVLKGAAVFLADLIRAVTIDLEIDFISLTSYGTGTTSSGKVHLHDLDNIEGRDVILVEGVVDTGHSVRFLLSCFRAQATSESVLLDKVPCRKVPVPVDYAEFASVTNS
jgi:hypoxanthine phosphoribosyltransferase